MTVFRIFTLTLLALPIVALANQDRPTEEQTSRALQQARRAAAMENSRDLPSRAVWLGQRVARHQQKLAFSGKKANGATPKAAKDSKTNSK